MTVIRLIAVPVLFVCAWLEVKGDALIYRGMLEKPAVSPVLAGCVTLALYGLGVNAVNWALANYFRQKWSLASLLGYYVFFFAFVSVAMSKPAADGTTWMSGRALLGLLLILAGSVVLQTRG